MLAAFYSAVTKIQAANAGAAIVANTGKPLANLRKPRRLQLIYVGAAADVRALKAGAATPTALAAADFEANGALDVVAGYATNGGGLLSLLRGNPDAYAPRNRSLYGKAMRGGVPAPFLPQASVVAVPESPDLLLTGDFNRDGYKDVLVAARGGALYLLAGDGHGHLLAPHEVPLPGRVRALAAADDAHVAVSLDAPGGPRVAILAPSPRGLSVTATHALPAPGDALAWGNLGGGADVVVGAGERVMMIYNALGTKAQTETISVPFRVSALALGDFIWDRDGRTEIGVLAHDGRIYLLQHGTLDAHPLRGRDLATRRAALRAQDQRLQNPTAVGGWQVAKALPYAGLPPLGTVSPSAFNSPRLAAAPSHDLLVLDVGQNELHILDTSGTTGSSSAVVSVSGAPVAALMLPRKINAQRDLVVLSSGESAPSLIAADPDFSFTVTTLNDEDDAGACPSSSTVASGAGADGVLSLREAVCEANNSGSASSVIAVPPGTYPLSISTYGGNGSLYESGEIQVGTAAGANISIVGTGTASDSIITQTDGLDRIFEQDQALLGNIAVSLSNVTLTGGTPTTGLDAAFGGGAILGGGAYGDDLVLSNVVMSNNTTASAAGGGAVSFLIANLTAVNSIFANNTAMQSSGGACACGSSSSQGNLVFTNATFSNNVATDASLGSPPGNDVGGALALTAGAGNTATISGSTFTANQAQGPNGVGGAVSGEGAITVSNSRIVGNGAVAGSGVAISGATSAGTLINNWWGCNAGPNNAGCDGVFIDTASGATGSASPWLLLGLSASAMQVLPNGLSTLTADVAHNSDGGGGFAVPDGTAVAFGATLGTDNPSSAATLNGLATSTFTAGAATGAGSGTATVDNQTVSVAIKIGQPPAILSATGATFTVGVTGAFTVTTTGAPNPSLTATGTLPVGIAFLDNGNGTGTLSGTPASGTGGLYPITLTAQNGFSPQATQSFLLTVGQAPAITSANGTTFALGLPGSFTLTTTAFPTARLTAGALPSGVGFVDNHDGTGTLSGTPTGNGVYSIAFTASNGVGSPAVQGFTLTVSQAQTTTTLSASANPSTYGQAVTLTALVSSASGTPSGTVTFKNGTASLGSATLTGGLAALSTSALTVGTKSLTAVYGGSTNFSGSTSAVLNEVVNKAASTVTLTSSANPATYGQAVTLTALVSSASGTPSGTVTFKNGTASLGSATLTGGLATLSTSGLGVGTKSLTAVYGGSTTVSASTSAVLNEVVNPAASTVTLTSSANPAAFGQAVTLTALVSSASGTPSGTVTFKNGTASLGSATLTGGLAALSTSALTVGTKSLTAVYGGSTTVSGSTSAVLNEVVNKAASTVTLTSSANPAAFGQAVTLTALVSSASGTPAGTVTFKNGTASLGSATLTGGLAALSTSALTVGTKSLTAVYGGSTTVSASTSAVLNEVVNPAASTVTLTSSANPAAFGQAVTLTALVSSASGTPAGTVTFKNGTASLGSATLAGGLATLTTSNLPAGTLAITSSYLGSANVSPGSATLMQTIVPAGASAAYTLTATALNPSSTTSGNAATATITLTPVSGYSGSITLTCNLIGGGTPSPGCSFNPSSVVLSGISPVSATLTVSTSTDTPGGSYSFSVTGSDSANAGPSNGAQLLALTTLPAGSPSYTLTATALNPGSISAGKTSTATITVTPANGYSGSVTLSCNISGSGTLSPSCSFSPSSVRSDGVNPGTSTLTVSTAVNTPGGSFVVSVGGSDANALAPDNGLQTLSLTAVGLIQHVVVIFQENRTPDNLFQDPILISRGADLASSGMNSHGQLVPLRPIDLGTVGATPQTYDLSHKHDAFLSMYDGGKMDGADLIPCQPASGATCPPNPQFMYVQPADVQPYFALAEQYTFADRMFQTNQGPSFPAHQFIISGTSAPTASSPLFAAENVAAGNAGCIAPPTTSVAMINAAGSETAQPFQYPCFEHPTLTDLLDSKGLTWRYYAPAAGSIWTAPDAIEHICHEQTVNGVLTCMGPIWTNNVIIPQTKVLTDIANGQLAQVSWIIPGGLQSDHAKSNNGSGPAWVASIVNAIGNSPYWANTAILITWDDWGGWYDHVPPKVINDGVTWGSGYLYGFRVPLIVASPYAKAAHISHVPHDFGSILKFIETNFNLPSLGYADTLADDLSDCFDLTQTPLPFKQIPASHNAAFFLNDKRAPTAPDDD